MEIIEYLRIQSQNEHIADPVVNAVFEKMKAASLECNHTALDALEIEFDRACKHYHAKERQIARLLTKVRKAPQEVDGYELSYSPDIRYYYIVGPSVMKGFRSAGIRAFLRRLPILNQGQENYQM